MLSFVDERRNQCGFPGGVSITIDDLVEGNQPPTYSLDFACNGNEENLVQCLPSPTIRSINDSLNCLLQISHAGVVCAGKHKKIELLLNSASMPSIVTYVLSCHGLYFYF